MSVTQSANRLLIRSIRFTQIEPFVRVKHPVDCVAAIRSDSMPDYNTIKKYRYIYPEKTNLIHIAAHAEADYIDPIEKEVFFEKTLPQDSGRMLLPLPDVNELEILKEFIETRMNWDRSARQKFLRQIKIVENESHGEQQVHHLGRYETYNKQEMDCYWSIMLYLEENRRLDDWLAFLNEQMLIIAKAWYNANELWRI